MAKQKEEQKKQKKAFYDSSRMLHRILPFVFISLGVLLGFFALTDLFGGENSLLGKGILNLLKGFFSTGTYFIPLLLLWHGIMWLQDIEKKRAISRGVYHLLFLIMYGALWFCFSHERNDIGYSVVRLFQNGVHLEGGGLLGGSLGFILYRLTSYIGAPFLTVAVICFYCYHFLGISPHALWQKRKASKGEQGVVASTLEEVPDSPFIEDAVDDGLFPESTPAPTTGVLTPEMQEELRQTHEAEKREERPKMTWREKWAQRKAEKARKKQAPTAHAPQTEEDDYYPATEEQSFDQLFREMQREAMTIRRSGVRNTGAPTVVTPTSPTTPVEEDPYFEEEELSPITPPSTSTTQTTFAPQAEPVSSAPKAGAMSAEEAFRSFNPFAQSAVINSAPTLVRPETDTTGMNPESPYTPTPEPTVATQDTDRSQFYSVPGGIRGNGEGMGSFMIHTQHMDIPSTRNPNPMQGQTPASAPAPTPESIYAPACDDAPATESAPVQETAEQEAPQAQPQTQTPFTADAAFAPPYYPYGYPYPPQGMYGQAPYGQPFGQMPYGQPYGQPYMPPYGMPYQGQPMAGQPTPQPAPQPVETPVETPVSNEPIVATDHVAEHPLRENIIVEQPKAQPRTQAASPAPAPKKPAGYENHVFPSLSLLTRSVPITNANSQAEVDETSARLVEEFRKFKLEITVHEVTVGPRVTRYSISPPNGVRMNTIIGLANDIALGLSVRSIRIEPVPNTPYLGVEIPTRMPQTVRLSSLIDTQEFRSTKTVTTVPLGANITGAPVFADIAKMPHVLIAGATGMGKSVLMNSILLSLLYKARPDEVKLILIDPKRVEMSMYNGIPHLLIPPVVEPQKAAGALIWATGEMERRYHLMEKASARSIEGYNEAVKSGRVEGEVQPKIIIVIDELNDLMMQARDAVEPAITSIAQKARAAGIHLIIGTQRPSVDVITGLIKANIPSRIALHVSSGTDSRTILDAYGAEKLLDKGDMLAVISGAEAIRVQSAFVSDEEVDNVTSFLRNNAVGGVYDEVISAQIDSETEKYRNSGKRGGDREEGDEDEGEGSYFEDSNFMRACEIALNNDKISTSLLQRTCGLGYGKAAKYIDRMYYIGLVSAPNGQKPRDVLMSREQFMEMVARETHSDI